MQRRVTSMVQWGLYWVAYLLSHVGRFLPKREGVWVFGADGGARFADNSKYLFLHVAAERPDVRPIWLTTDDELVAALRSSGYEAYRADRPRGIYYTLVAEWAFVCLGRADLAWWATGGTPIVNLWHGCPLKRLTSAHDDASSGRIERAVAAIRDGGFDALVTTADELRPIFADVHDLPLDRVPALGYPRNDVLVEAGRDADLGNDRSVAESIREYAEEGPVVAYVPTYRRGFGMSHGDDEGPPIDEDALDEVLAAHDATFLLKHHPHAFDRVDAGASDRIVELPDDYDLYPSLGDVDVLITDYSSIYFDYLFVDRPIVFYAYDREAYEADPGLYFDYDAVTPGPTPENFPSFRGALEDALAGVDEYETERAAVRERFFDDPDGRSAERVATYFADR